MKLNEQSLDEFLKNIFKKKKKLFFSLFRINFKPFL